ncbi:MAG: glycosyltransferase family 2 protein [Thermodesulfovibrionales bacterium]
MPQAREISIIITTYNNPEYLKRVLGCFFKQILNPFEIIIADDGSTGDTRALVADFASRSPFEIIHVWHEDMGFRAAKIRNEALKVCRGQYVILLDGDCLVDRHFVSDHQRLAERGFFFQGKRVLIDRVMSQTIDEKVINSKRFDLFISALKGHIKNSHHLIRMPLIPAIRNRLLKGTRSCNLGGFVDDFFAVNGFDERFIGWGYEDSEFVSRLFKYGLKRKEHPFMAVCYHLWHEQSKKDNEQNLALLRSSIDEGGYYSRFGIKKVNSAEDTK